MREENGRILIFGGTTEGRMAAERLLARDVPCTVCVATQYGEEVLQPHPRLTVHTGRLDRAGMAQLMLEETFSCVIDATHPHARLVSQEIRAACAQTGLPCLRLQREDADLESRIQNAGQTGAKAEAEAAEKTGVKAETGAKAEAAEKTGVKAETEAEDKTCLYVNDVEEAGTFLAAVPGRILVTTGSKELARFTRALGDPSRVTARVLPAQESLKACVEAGLAGKQIFAMQGPFGTDMNCALIRHAGAAWLLTKQTGAVGGYPEKIEAARKCGIRAVVIRTPSAENASNEPIASNESGGTVLNNAVLPLEQTIEKALQYAGRDIGRGEQSGCMEGSCTRETAPPETALKGEDKRILSLVGVGVGAREAGTQEAQEAIASARVLFGAKSVLENLTKTWPQAAGKKVIASYDSGKILEYLEKHPEIRNAAVACSGDSGFYSGASSLLAKIKEAGSLKKAGSDKENAGGNTIEKISGGTLEGPRKGIREETLAENLEVRVICGISSISWFAARAGIPWQDWKILSSHGRFCNVVGQARRNRECFLLLAGAADLRQTGALLARAQEQGVLGKLQLLYGYELSRAGERICPCTPQDLLEVTREGLYVLYIRHEDAEKIPVMPGLPDTAFIRGKAPMTSSEIRALSLCRLGLTARSVFWDVGAGTGSVSVEAALTCPEGRVWSIEYKKDALALLAENRAKYCLQNMSIIEGRAPEALADLPAPTHVFIGGSGGEIGSILDLVFARNPQAAVVVNCITPETLAALRQALDRLPVRGLQCAQVMVNREETLGSYHYLRAGNPVFIISFRGAAT